MTLPYRINTTDRKRFRTSHGLISCRRASVIDAYDTQGNQHIVFTANIAKHSAGKLNRVEQKPEAEPCGYYGHGGNPVTVTDHWPFCGYCGGV